MLPDDQRDGDDRAGDASRSSAARMDVARIAGSRRRGARGRLAPVIAGGPFEAQPHLADRDLVAEAEWRDRRDRPPFTNVPFVLPEVLHVPATPRYVSTAWSAEANGSRRRSRCSRRARVS
jgi:hypothetical protein